MLKKLLILILIIAGFLYYRQKTAVNTNIPEPVSGISQNNNQNQAKGIQIKSKSKTAKGYVKNAVSSNGSLFIWDKSPVTYYIPQGIYYDASKKAITAWEENLKGYINLQEIPSRSQSDIAVEFVTKLDRLSTKDSYKLGVTLCSNNGHGSIGRCTISLLAYDPNTKKPMSGRYMYDTVLHEFGHALGIAGHSPNKGDIMYPTSSFGAHLSGNDIYTVRIMYSNNSSLIQQHLTGASETKVAEAEEYVKKIPDKALGWINLGKTYYDTKQYPKAVQAFAKALSLDSEDPEIYVFLSNCYFQSKNYSASLRFSKEGLSKNPSSNIRAALSQTAGLSYALKKDYKSAFPYFKDALQYDSNNKGYLTNLLVACANLGYRSEAATYLKNYLSDNPSAKFDKDLKEFMKWCGL